MVINKLLTTPLATPVHYSPESGSFWLPMTEDQAGVGTLVGGDNHKHTKKLVQWVWSNRGVWQWWGWCIWERKTRLWRSWFSQTKLPGTSPGQETVKPIVNNFTLAIDHWEQIQRCHMSVNHTHYKPQDQQWENSFTHVKVDYMTSLQLLILGQTLPILKTHSIAHNNTHHT